MPAAPVMGHLVGAPWCAGTRVSARLDSPAAPEQRALGPASPGHMLAPTSQWLQTGHGTLTDRAAPRRKMADILGIVR